jgi:hypothetical protein
MSSPDRAARRRVVTGGRTPAARLALLFLLGCSGGGSSNDGNGTGNGTGNGRVDPPPARVPTSITLSPPGSMSFDALQATQSVTATVLDQSNQPLTGTAIRWASSDTTVARVSDLGVVTSVRNGPARITAAAGTASSFIDVTVQQRPTAIEATSGGAQTGAVGTALTAPLVVTVKDRIGTPVAQASVAFTVAGGGSVAPATATTGTNGQASTIWTLGTSASATQSVTASVTTAAGVTTTFASTARAAAAATATKFGGDAQMWSATKPLPDPLSVRVTDSYNNPVPGVAVAYSVVAGGGSLSSASVNTDANGEARVTWTMGQEETPQQARAQVAGVTPPTITFTARSLRSSMGDIGPAPIRTGCTPSIPGKGFYVSPFTRNQVTVDGVAATITGGTGTVDNAFLVIRVPTVPNNTRHNAVVQVTAYGTTLSRTVEFDPASEQCVPPSR